LGPFVTAPNPRRGVRRVTGQNFRGVSHDPGFFHTGEATQAGVSKWGKTKKKSSKVLRPRSNDDEGGVRLAGSRNCWVRAGFEEDFFPDSEDFLRSTSRADDGGFEGARPRVKTHRAPTPGAKSSRAPEPGEVIAEVLPRRETALDGGGAETRTKRGGGCAVFRDRQGRPRGARGPARGGRAEGGAGSTLLWPRGGAPGGLPTICRSARRRGDGSIGRMCWLRGQNPAGRSSFEPRGNWS